MTDLATLEAQVETHLDDGMPSQEDLETLECLKELKAFRKSKRKDTLFQFHVAQEIRRIRNCDTSNKSIKGICNICEQHISICQWHHTPSIADFVYLASLYNGQNTQFTYHIIALCPNHHAYYHKMENAYSKGLQQLSDTFDEITEQTGLAEAMKLLNLVIRRARELLRIKREFQDANK